MRFGERLRTCLLFVIGSIYGWFFATWQIMVKLPMTIMEPDKKLLFWETWICYLIVLLSAFALILLLGYQR